MQHGRVVWCLGRGVGAMNAECSRHVSKEEGRDDAETPGSEEFEEEVEGSGKLYQHIKREETWNELVMGPSVEGDVGREVS